MDQQLSMNLVSKNPEVATLIANDDEVTSLLPFVRPIEVLVDPSIKPEGGLPHFTR